MNYEKKYKEALERAKKCLDEKHDTCFVRPDVIFPELKESEDEQTRKEIFHFILDNTLSTDMRQHRWLAWLEKQRKSKWTEEDEDYFNDLESYFINLEPLKHRAAEAVNWLKSLKQRMEE